MHIQQQDKHNGVWNVIEPFLVNDNVHKTDLKLHSVEAINKHTNSGIIVLANLFLEGNLQMRSQAIDAFYQVRRVFVLMLECAFSLGHLCVLPDYSYGTIRLVQSSANSGVYGIA